MFPTFLAVVCCHFYSQRDHLKLYQVLTYCAKIFSSVHLTLRKLQKWPLPLQKPILLCFSKNTFFASLRKEFPNPCPFPTSSLVSVPGIGSKPVFFLRRILERFLKIWLYHIQKTCKKPRNTAHTVISIVAWQDYFSLFLVLSLNCFLKFHYWLFLNYSFKGCVSLEHERDISRRC